MRVDGIGARHGAAGDGRGNVGGLPEVAPGIGAAVGALRGKLPLPLVRQALAGPLGVGARIFKRDPGDGAIVPALRIAAVLPVAQKVDGVGGRVVRGVEELLELGVGDGELVDEERGHLHLVLVEAARGVFPWVLDIDAGVVAAFDLGTLHAEVETRRRECGSCLRELRLRARLAGWERGSAAGSSCSCEKDASGCCRHCGHALHEGLDFGGGLGGSGEDGAVAVGFDVEAEHGGLALPSVSGFNSTP